MKLVDVPMLDADGLVPCPGCVLPGRPGVVLDVPVPDGLPVVPVVVLGVIGDADGLIGKLHARRARHQLEFPAHRR